MADVGVAVVDVGAGNVVTTVAMVPAFAGCTGIVTGATRAEAAITPAAKACFSMSDHPVS
ncbi:hypothetical protein [Microtetraspora sp. NBRC 16547]|uniref:hypothetical protein n=1 Tax=Microtetraspora sp. NBRC 16547 TaxID=3030993 RepID=UPI0024A30A90|nr:hypothetical protein [Microtetraspora sp. NBRC 16547]GLW99907.1 hypothetical protein Misp02_39940 [Microtetraspora sp. NBRC 16547]